MLPCQVTDLIVNSLAHILHDPLNLECSMPEKPVPHGQQCQLGMDP